MAPPLPFDVGAVGMLLLKEVGGALVLAMAAGIVTYQMLKRVDNYQVEVLLTLALADALHLSAPIAAVVAGLFVGNRGRTFAMSEKTREHVDTFWELVDEILNVVLFLLIGLELLVLPIERGWLVAGALAIPIALSARWLSVAAIIGPLGWVTAQAKGAIPMSGGPSVFSRTLMAPWMSDRKQVSHNVQDLRHSKDKRISRCLLSTVKSPKKR
ncbi:MAG: cation:proton antiporter [Chromatiaceae bacterium]